jgi:hypothetical protein
MSVVDLSDQDSLRSGGFSISRCPFEPRPGAWHRDVALRDSSRLLLGLALVAVAQVREYVRNVSELLFEVALERLQPLDQLGAVREAAAEKHPRTSTPTMVTVMHVHLLSS